MNVSSKPSDGGGPFDARYLVFLETITHLRPQLHRYCARMTGSVMDGEDVVQDALFNAYRRIETLNEDAPFAPWLFQIAHNRCIDFIRRRSVRMRAESESEQAKAADPTVGHTDVGHAIEHLVMALPPKERACLLLKDVFDYSLDEVAGIVGSTNGGVKASLHRARAKLDSRMSGGPKAARKMDKPEAARILKLYVERFNKQDWEGVRDLIAADAKLLVADRFSGRLTDAPYFSRYAAMSEPWRFAVGTIDGEPALIALRLRDSTWTAVSVARVEVNNGLVRSVVDYTHCNWVFALAGSVVVSEG